MLVAPADHGLTACFSLDKRYVKLLINSAPIKAAFIIAEEKPSVICSAPSPPRMYCIFYILWVEIDSLFSMDIFHHDGKFIVSHG